MALIIKFKSCSSRVFLVEIYVPASLVSIYLKAETGKDCEGQIKAFAVCCLTKDVMNLSRGSTLGATLPTGSRRTEKIVAIMKDSKKPMNVGIE